MTDSNGNRVLYGSLVRTDIGNIRLNGTVGWDWQSMADCICCLVADIKCPLQRCNGFYLIPWQDVQSLGKEEVEAFVRKLRIT